MHHITHRTQLTLDLVPIVPTTIHTYLKPKATRYPASSYPNSRYISEACIELCFMLLAAGPISTPTPTQHQHTLPPYPLSIKKKTNSTITSQTLVSVGCRRSNYFCNPCSHYPPPAPCIVHRHIMPKPQDYDSDEADEIDDDLKMLNEMNIDDDFNVWSDFRKSFCANGQKESLQSLHT